MPRGGRYRYIRVAMWGEPRFRGLSADARLLLLNLRTGSASNLAGIAHVFIEALERETGLTPGEIRNSFEELQKAGLVVYDQGVAWVKDQLKTDPSRENDPNITNPKHRVAIQSILGSLPRESLAVKKFREVYKFRLHRVSRTPSHKASPTPSHTVGVSPEIRDRRTENREQRSETGEGEPERKHPPTFAYAMGSNGQKIPRQDAPAEWFNDCGEGRAKRCLKTEYFDRVDLPDKCTYHRQVRQELRA
jgi:hypothetical protein